MSDFLYVYIDESGDLGKYGSKYFTIAAVMVENPLILKRIIKRVKEKKLKKKIKDLPELKANKSDRITREYILNYVSKTACSIISIVVEKNNVIDPLFNVKNKLYNYLCGILMDKINTDVYKLIITIDKKHTNTLIREDFDRYIKKKLLLKNKKLKLEIYQKNSHLSNELQIVDFVSWAINRKFNSKDDYYFRFIENKVINKEKMILWK